MASKSIEEMMEMVKKSPAEFIKFLEDNDIDFKKASEDLDLGRKIVKERYHMTDDDISAVEFIFWFSYFVEREAQDLIIEPEVQLGARKEAVQILTDKLHFGDKISVIEELYVKNQKDTFVSLMRKVQNLRNAIAHGRFNQLSYDGYELIKCSRSIKNHG